MQFLMAHYKDIILALVAIDAALIPIFPQVQILVKIKDLLVGVAPKS